jgi:GTP pyrophosphokinase
MGDPGHLGHVIRAVQKVDGVLEANRVTGGRRDSAR